MKVEVTQDDGSVVDITEGVKTLYDLLHNSMDWGSNFLSVEDVFTVTVVAQACGFLSIQEVDEQTAAYMRSLVGWNCLTCGATVEEVEFVEKVGYYDREHLIRALPCGHLALIQGYSDNMHAIKAQPA